MSKKTALITGVNGQDGSYLAELLIEKGYEVHGVRRRVSTFNTHKIDHLYADPHDLGESKNALRLHYGDMTDALSLTKLVESIRPSEVYNLAAQSHVGVSFENPEYTTNVNALGTLRLLEGIKSLGLEREIRFYQASTSELFGSGLQVPQSEKTPFHPCSPYAVSKLFAYWITQNFREAYGMFACNGILFNHESPRRGETFVTRKISIGLAKIKYGLQDTLYLGNLNALRDWGHAKDYVLMQWMMLQAEEAGDYVIATGRQATVRDFVNLAAAAANMQIEWVGEGLQERALDSTGRIIVAVDPEYFRPAEVDNLLGDAALASKELGWQPTITLEALVQEMVDHDLNLVSQSL